MATKKVKSIVTNTKGQKVTSYTDGTKTYSGGSSSSSTKAPAKSVQQQVADIVAQGQKIQKTYDAIKGTMTQSEIDKTYDVASKATTATKSLVDSGNVARATGGTLPKAEAPSTPLGITPMDTPKIPTTTPSVVNPAGAISVSEGMKTYMDAIQKQLEQQQARNDKMAKENQSLMEKTLGTMKNPEDVYDQAWKDTGMSTKEYFATQESGIKQIESLNNEYATVQGAMEQQIAQSNDKMASMNFINNQTAQIRRNAEPQLNTISAQISSKAATLQALQGNFAEARSLVRDAVDAATAGNKFKYDMYQALYEQNQDNFDRVDKSYSEAYSNAMNIALKDYEMQREEKMQIGELMLKYPSAGIDMNGSLDEAFERAGVSAGTASSGGFTQKEINRAMQVLNGQSAMSDFTTAEQAKIRDTIWSLDTNTAGYTGQYPRSYAPGALDNEFNSLKMSVAGPGAGQTVTPVGELTSAQQSEGLNKLYSMGASPEDVMKFQSDREFQAWVLNQE